MREATNDDPLGSHPFLASSSSERIEFAPTLEGGWIVEGRTEPLKRTVVISDMHFGDRTQLLNDASLVERFVGVLAGRGPIAEIVLLGDVLDLWVSTPVPAFREARYFIRKLSMLPNVGGIVYVPGNHDHQIFMNAFTAELEGRLLVGDLSAQRFLPARSYENCVLSGLADSSSGIPFSMVYPFIVRRVRDREVLIAHGHHLDFYDSSFGWARSFWLGRRIIKKRRRNATLYDIEMANLPFCGAMSVAPWAPELVEKGLRYYRIINFFSKLFRRPAMLRSPRRDTLIADNYDEISGLLPLFGHPHPACFIFGHTHRPGIGKIPGSGIAIANTGSWVAQNEADVPMMTWVELEHDVKLYRLSGDAAEIMFSESV